MFDTTTMVNTTVNHGAAPEIRRLTLRYQEGL